MTLDELMKVYDKAASDVAFLQYEGPDHRAGIRAVVTALRDEIADAYERGFDDATSEDWGSPRRHRSNHACAESIINEILASDGVKSEGSE